MALLYAIDYFLTAWALSTLSRVAEANPLWPLAAPLTALAVLFYYIISSRYWCVKAIRYVCLRVEL